MIRLLVFLTDPLRAFYEKGEVKPRYYNPENLFSEVHFISPARNDIEAEKVQCFAGNASMTIHSLGPAYYPYAFFPYGRIAKIVATIQPAAVRAYDPSLRGAVTVYCARRLKIPSVISIHADLDEQRASERRFVHYLRIPFEEYALPRATSVMCVSRHVAEYAKRRGAESPVVIYNRVDTDKFMPRAGVAQSSPEALRPLSILTVGRLVPQKFHECLIRAIVTVRANLTIVGDGFQRTMLEQLARDLGVRDRITFIASVRHADIPEQYRGADVFAIATHYEGFCIPALEAMACGLPVVASDVGPLPEIIADAGLLLENQPEAFSAAFQRLAADPDLRSRLGARGRERALVMNAAMMEKREADLYRTLLSYQ